MKSLDYLKIVQDRGLATYSDCSTLLWVNKVSDKSQEEFLTLVRENENFSSSEMMFAVNKLQDVFPADIIEAWIRKLTANPGAAAALCALALTWTDNRKNIFFDEFIKTFADNPHYHLSQAMFAAGALE